MTAPAIGGAAILLAVALVWYLRPQPEISVETADAPQPRAQVTGSPAPRTAEPSSAESARATPTESVKSPVSERAARSPLPGETPAAPMAELFANRQQNVVVQRGDANSGVPPQVAEGEREFAAEPVDATWASGAEAALLAKFAQMPGLELIDLQVECRSTMCRLQVTQPRAVTEVGASPFNLLYNDSGMKPRWMMVVPDGPLGGPGPMRSIAYLWRDGFAPEREQGAAHDAK
ncbi:MAG TPA: hypothetical protein VM692_15580 [Gammaproteobacteria bacterium]|nr:hypothetical protein [Gammaproteobacteria bacterium]